MTDKLFTLKHFESQDWAYDNNKPIHTKEMVDLLNELHEENEHLKQSFKEVLKDLEATTFDKELLEKENEQLKQFKEDVFNTIDMHLRMLPTARDNEFNEDDGDPSLYTGAIYMLETLKKEMVMKS